MQNEMNNVQNMTPDQARSYFASLPKIDILTDMVSQGVISQATADAIKAAQQVRQANLQNGNGQAPNFRLRANAEEWVDNGLIDQATADKINSYLANLDPSTITPQTGNNINAPGSRGARVDVV